MSAGWSSKFHVAKRNRKQLHGISHQKLKRTETTGITDKARQMEEKTAPQFHLFVIFSTTKIIWVLTESSRDCVTCPIDWPEWKHQKRAATPAAIKRKHTTMGFVLHIKRLVSPATCDTAFQEIGCTTTWNTSPLCVVKSRAIVRCAEMCRRV